MKPPSATLVCLLSALILCSGCLQPTYPPAAVPSGTSVAIVYGSDKGDLSYTDAAYRGLAEAQQETGITIQEYVPADYQSLPLILNATAPDKRPSLIITVGFQYADFTRSLAQAHPDIRFLAIDQAGIGSDNVRAYEISSYGDSYLAGALAAMATKTGKAGIIMAMQSGVLDEFLAGYTAGARAVNSSIVIDSAYVQRDSTAGFSNPDEAERIARMMHNNGTDVIYACAGYSNTGVFRAAGNTTGLYAIGTDSDQSPLGPGFILASAVKRVDRIVYNGVTDTVRDTYRGGNTVAGLKAGATGITFNPAFVQYNGTINAWEVRAREGEAQWLSSRGKTASP